MWITIIVEEAVSGVLKKKIINFSGEYKNPIVKSIFTRLKCFKHFLQK